MEKFDTGIMKTRLLPKTADKNKAVAEEGEQTRELI